MPHKFPQIPTDADMRSVHIRLQKESNKRRQEYNIAFANHCASKVLAKMKLRAGPLPPMAYIGPVWDKPQPPVSCFGNSTE